MTPTAKNGVNCVYCTREGAECEGCKTDGLTAADLIRVYTEGMSIDELAEFYERILETEGLRPI